MRLRSYYLFVLLFLIAGNITAQVHRKGVGPIQKGNGWQQPVGATFTLDQFKGKWQEDKRTNYAGTPASFTDSLQIAFWDADSAETKSTDHNHFSMYGQAQIDPDNTLTVAGDQYIIKSVTADQMVLDDGQSLHIFKKVDDFYTGQPAFATASTDDKDEFSGPIQASLNNIMGNWAVYRRYVKPGVVTDKIALIRYLNITTQTGANTANATITVYTQELTDSSTTVEKPATVTLNGNNIKIVTDTNTWDLPVYKADGSEFVFGTKSFRYYCKLNTQK